MKLIGDGADGRKVIVRVKLDPRSREWRISVLAVYEVFCNLKQVGPRLNVCRGGSRFWCERSRRLYVFAVILGNSKSHHTVRSSAWGCEVAAKKLPECISVFSVDNEKIGLGEKLMETLVIEKNHAKGEVCRQRHWWFGLQEYEELWKFCMARYIFGIISL
ncbi:hypothetical protein VNO80_17235 [Phaseolus coccineus]|uniref:Uncharacterized protein n=1 Tax=Phaseolus coccineus TaxID=3886 RepID=A0AAN9MUR7_PHACN